MLGHTAPSHSSLIGERKRKGGRGADREDVRRVVFQTALVMFELDRLRLGGERAGAPR